MAYTTAAAEHRAVREHCGLFDVSHMGVLELRGPATLASGQRLLVNDLARLGDGDGQYTLMCNPHGGVVDDLIVFRLHEERLVLVVNAANVATDIAWIREHAARGVEVDDRSGRSVLLALQGPDAERALRPRTSLAVDTLPPFGIRAGTVAGHPALVARTGYTGEDGFEILVEATDAAAVWDALLDGVRRQGGLPAGLAARDTLRLEAGLPLYGFELDTTTTPLEAGLGWVVKLGKGAFLGREALSRQVATGVGRSLVGLQMEDAGVPRHGQAVWIDGAPAGVVTSGCRSPTLGAFIGMAYVPPAATRPGTPIEIAMRGRRLPARVASRPFYRRVGREKHHARA